MGFLESTKKFLKDLLYEPMADQKFVDGLNEHYRQVALEEQMAEEFARRQREEEDRALEDDVQPQSSDQNHYVDRVTEEEDEEPTLDAAQMHFAAIDQGIFNEYAEGVGVVDELVRDNLNENINLNVTNRYGQTVLERCILAKNRDEVVRDLLKHGADPDFKNPVTKDTPLISAVRANNRVSIKDLLYYGADVDLQGKDLNTAMHVAVQQKHYTHVKDLLVANPDLTIQNKDGDTPLHLAVKSGEMSIVGKLLEAEKIDVTQVNKQGKTAKDYLDPKNPEHRKIIAKIDALAQKQQSTQEPHVSDALRSNATLVSEAGATQPSPVRSSARSG